MIGVTPSGHRSCFRLFVFIAWETCDGRVGGKQRKIPSVIVVPRVCVCVCNKRVYASVTATVTLCQKREPPRTTVGRNKNRSAAKLLSYPQRGFAQVFRFRLHPKSTSVVPRVLHLRAKFGKFPPTPSSMLRPTNARESFQLS